MIWKKFTVKIYYGCRPRFFVLYSFNLLQVQKITLVFLVLTLKKIFPVTEVYSEPCQTSKIEFKPLTILAKCSILDVWEGSEYVFLLCSEAVLKNFPIFTGKNLCWSL